jgi:MSHA biogenesis protein MshN
MSLINQMLKDLEQRGAGSVNIDKVMAHQFGIASANNPLKNSMVNTTFLKAAGVILLLTGGAYCWSQQTPRPTFNDHEARTPLIEKQDSASNNISTSTLPAPTKEVTASAQPPVKLKSATTEIQQNDADKKLPLIKAAPISTESPPTELTSQSNQAKTDNVIEIANVSEKNPVTNIPEKLATASHVPSKNTNNEITAIGKRMSPEQKLANLYTQALVDLQQGRVTEAQNKLNQVLEGNPADQEARQTLLNLLLANKQYDQAQTLLTEGLTLAPEQSGFRMMLARLQVETRDYASALNTLEQGQVYAKNNAEYQSFYATLLQRADRHEEAINHYNAALALNSNSANDFIGLGISLDTIGKLLNAQEAFNRALGLATLSPELAEFANQQLKIIHQRLQNSTTN